MQLLATCWLTLPSIHVSIPLFPRLPRTIRSASLAFAASMMRVAGFPSMKMGTARCRNSDGSGPQR